MYGKRLVLNLLEGWTDAPAAMNAGMTLEAEDFESNVIPLMAAGASFQLSSKSNTK